MTKRWTTSWHFADRMDFQVPTCVYDHKGCRFEKLRDWDWQQREGHPSLPHPFALRSRPIEGAFSLIELLVMLAISSILVVLLLPSLTHAKGNARRLECMARLKQ